MELLKECIGAKRIGISGHIRPDGDCVGSCLGLYLYLKKSLPECDVKVFLDNPPEIFAEIEGFDCIESQATEEEYDVFFALDCSADRLEMFRPMYDGAKKKINIDHHISNSGCGDVNYIFPKASSASELVYDLIGEDGLDEAIAKALYIGIIHDCGVFQYSCTSPKTMMVSAKLMEMVPDFPRIIEETFYQKTYVQTQIMGRSLMESIRFMDGACIVSSVSKRDMEFYGVTTKDLDGIVNQLRNIKGVHCAIFMYETDVLEYKVSMRSDEMVDVAQVASYFGGGGHVRAAGCTMKGTFHDCVNNLSLHIAKQLEG